MRSSVIAGLLMLLLAALGLRAHMRSRVAIPAQAFAQQPAAPQPPIDALRPAAAAAQDARRAGFSVAVRTSPQAKPIWKDEVQGLPKTTAAAARQEALEKAADRLADYLHERIPGFRYRPTTRFLLDEKMVDEGATTEQILHSAPEAPVMQVHTLKLELRESHLAQLLQEDRRERSVERLWQGGRVLGGLLVALLALIGYYRLDDWTKGYFSMALKLSAIALAVAGAVLLWWLV